MLLKDNFDQYGRSKPSSNWLQKRQLKDIKDVRGRNGFMLAALNCNINMMFFLQKQASDTKFMFDSNYTKTNKLSIKRLSEHILNFSRVNVLINTALLVLIKSMKSHVNFGKYRVQ